MVTATDEAKATVQILAADKLRLDALKVHPAQPIREVIRQLLDEREAAGKAAHGAQEPR